MKRLALLALLLSTTAYSDLKNLDQQETHVINSLQNPGFENGLAKYSASGSSTLAATKTDAYLGTSGLWTASGAGEFFRSTAVSVPKGLQGQSCLARIWYLADSITAGDVVARVTNGVSAISEDASLATTDGNYYNVDIGFNCPTSGNYLIELESIAAGSVLLDQMHLGSDFRVGETSTINTTWASYTPTNTQGLGTVTNVTMQWKRSGDTIHIRGGFTTGTVSSNELQIELPPGLTISSPSPDAQIVGRLLGDQSSTNVYGVLATDGDTFLNVGRVEPGGGNPATRRTGAQVMSSSTRLTLFTTAIQIEEWKNQGTTKTVTTENQDWYIDASIGGVNINLGTAAQSSFVPITNGSLDLVNNNQSPVGIACSSGEGSVGVATCPSSSESLGIVFNTPVTGKYEVCSNVTVSSDGGAFSMRLVHTQNADNTVIAQGTQRLGNRSADGSQPSHDAIQNCDTFNLSAGKNTIRLFRVQASATTAPQMLIDRSSGTSGDRDMNWKVKRISGGNSTIAIVPATATSAGGVLASESVTKAVNGDFSGDDVVFRKDADGWVTVQFPVMTHASGSAPGTASGFIPSNMQPSDSIQNIYSLDGGGLRAIEVQAGGIIRTRYFDGNNNTLNRTTSEKIATIIYYVGP